MILKQVGALAITWQMKLGVDIELHSCFQTKSALTLTLTYTIIPWLAKHEPFLHNPYDCWEYICSDIHGFKFHCYLASQIKASEFAINAAARTPYQSECKIDLYHGALVYDRGVLKEEHIANRVTLSSLVLSLNQYVP